MQETDFRNMDRKRLSLAEITASSGLMEERKAMGIVRALCSRLMDEREVKEADLAAFHPKTILLSSEGTISFSGDTVPESVREAYYPPEYVRGSTPRESVLIYGMGILLLFLVTGHERKTGMDAGIKNRALKNVINRCTALDTRRRFQSLMEVRAALNRELVFPRKRMVGLALTVGMCIMAVSSFYMYTSGRTIGQTEGRSVGYQNGYKDGYDTAVTDAPGIGVEDIVFPEEYGNLPGNLHSKEGAFAVVGDDYIYFTCNGRIYQMDPYTRETSVLTRHKTVASLNYWQGYLYYFTEDALVRMDVGSGQEETVNSRFRGQFCIYNSTIYLDDEVSTGYLYGIDTVSLETRQLNSRKTFDYLNVVDGQLFFADPEISDNLFRCDYDGGNMIRLLSKACRDIELYGDSVYCLTKEKDEPGGADTLVSMNSAGGEAYVMTAQPVSRFIAVKNGIFYISSLSGNLEWMTTDGRTRYTICTSAVSDFNLAGRWIFYRLAGDNTLYRMRINGSDRERVS